MASRTGPDDVPRLPRGSGGWLRGPHLFKIAATGLMLFVVVFMRKPCASSASKFMGSFEASDARLGEPPTGVLTGPDMFAPPVAAPATNDNAGLSGTLIPLGGTDAEIAAAIAAARARASGRAVGSNQ